MFKNTVYMYNGAKVEFQRKASRLDILSSCARLLRLPPEVFKFCALFSGQHFSLPYSKKSIDTHLKGECFFKIVTPILDLKDVVRQYPEVFSYLYFQVLHYFHTVYSPTCDDHKEIVCLNVAIKLCSLGLSTVSTATLQYLLNNLDYKHVNSDNILQQVTNLLEACNKDNTAMKFKLIKQIEQMYCGSECSYEYENVDRERCVVRITVLSLQFNSDTDDIIMHQVEKVKFSFKHHTASLVLLDNKEMQLNLLSRSSLESFLTILDMAYKATCPGNQILDHKLSDDLDTESLVYHDPEYTNSVIEDETKSSTFNYSLVEGCCMVRKVSDKLEVEKILRFPGNETKFLVTENFMMKDHMKLVNQYFFFILIGDRIIARTIYIVGGRFKIDDQQRYLSLFKLFSQIELMDKKGTTKKKREFVDYIKKEDIMKIKEHHFVCNTKGEPTTSALNVSLSPVPTGSHYLYTTHNGVMHANNMLRAVSVTQIISHNQEFDSFILGPLIEHIKGLRTRGIDHENVVEYFGVYRLHHLPCLIEVEFGVSLAQHLQSTSCPVAELYGFGKQIVSGLLYLHEKGIVHGFPALHNVKICDQLIKLTFVGILPQLVKRRDVYNSLLLKDYLDERGTFQEHPARWLHRSMIFSNALWNIEVDRYVFGCTLWQLFNAGARPLPDKSDQDILDKLEGKDCSWFNGGSYFTLPHTRTDFYNKLQKIICVCVTWGNKDNMVKYEFRKIAEAYEKLADVVNNDQPSTTDFILKAGSGRLDFDVNTADASNSKYTLVEEDDSKRVILVSKKIPLTELGQVKDMLLESEKLLTLDDLQRPDGSKFAAPSPGSVEVEAVCKKLGLGQRVWVKCYSKCKDIPENDYIEEVKHLLRFQHQNIVPLQGCIPLDNSLLLLTPSFKSYRSLRDFIDSNNNTITGKQRESYATQICSGMKYLASNNCVHRNLCLSHIYLPNKSNVVIANFGLARVTEALYYQQKRNLVSDTFVIYPPEVISVLCGGGKVKFRSSCDVWSYGVLLWELYSGQVAYNNLVMDIHGNQDLALLDQFFRAGHVLEPEAGWPPHVRLVVEKCLKEEESRASFYEIEEILLKR